jgi:hypothetical protein
MVRGAADWYTNSEIIVNPLPIPRRQYLFGYASWTKEYTADYLGYIYVNASATGIGGKKVRIYNVGGSLPATWFRKGANPNTGAGGGSYTMVELSDPAGNIVARITAPLHYPIEFENVDKILVSTHTMVGFNADSTNPVYLYAEGVCFVEYEVIG